MNIVTKKWGEKREKKSLAETHVYPEQKTMDKNRLERVRKHVFYKHTNIVNKKNARKKFVQKATYIAIKKRWKKIVWKKCENTFFYKHMKIVTKNGGKEREKKFFQKHIYIARKNDGKNSSAKSAKTRFL